MFDTPFPPGAAKALFAREYEDIYSFSKPLTFSSYLDWVRGDVGAVVITKIKMTGKLAADMILQFGPLLLLRWWVIAVPRKRDTQPYSD